MNGRLRAVLLPLAAFLVLIAVWEAAVAAFHVPPFLLPAPSAIVRAVTQFGPTFLTVHATATLETILIGFALSVMIGVPLGTALAANKLTAEALYPLLIFTHAIPIIAIAPIIVVVFGTGLGSRLIVVTLISFFPTMVSTATGILNVPADMLELAHTAGASRWQTTRTIKLPSAVPFIFSGLRIGITGAVVGAVVAEFVSAEAGLGYLVVRATNDFNIPLAMGAVIALATLSVVLYQLVAMTQRLVMPGPRT